eukprot:8215365-Pyramimonas_sp.AAC.1
MLRWGWTVVFFHRPLRSRSRCSCRTSQHSISSALLLRRHRSPKKKKVGPLARREMPRSLEREARRAWDTH